MDFCNARKKYSSLNSHSDAINNYVPPSSFMKIYKKEKDSRRNSNFLLKKSQSLSSQKLLDVKEYCPWVQKYRPTKFTDLLSLGIPQCNILRFLSEWKDAIAKKVADSIDLSKILLISGPSGVGKTCVAHCATIASGFHPIEINAGEGRSIDVVKEVIMSAISNNHIIDNRPSILIIDEIDASSDNSPLISFIIKLVQNTKNPLKRPIIIICTDLYSPNLRPIRMIPSSLLTSQPLSSPTPSQISKYLNDIIIKEGHLKLIDQRHLMTLIISMDCDLRAILNALQFHFSTQNISPTSSLSNLLKDDADLKHNPLRLSRDLFKGNKVKVQDSTLIERVLSNSLDLLPEYWGLMDGSCESIRGHGGSSSSSSSSSLSSLQRLSMLYNELSISTLTQNSLSFIRKSFSTNTKSPKDFRIPRRDYSLQKEIERIASSCQNNNVNNFLERNYYLSRIIDHAIKEMKVSNVQLLKEGSLETLKLKRIIDLMISENISFILDKSTKSFKLNPNIEWNEFDVDGKEDVEMGEDGEDVGDVVGDGRLHSNHINSVKQMISSLIAKSRIDVSRSGVLEKAYSSLAIGGQEEIEKNFSSSGKRKSYFIMDRSMKKIKKEGHVDGDSDGDSEMVKEGIKFWFKYNEGFSNAVRRTIRMEDLFSKPQKNNK